MLPNGWIEVLTADTFSQISTGTKKVKTKDCKAVGKFPVIDQGQADIAGFVDDESKVINVVKPLVIFGDHTRAIKWIIKDFVPGADGTKVLEAADFLEPKYFYYQLRSLELPDKGYARHFRYLNETLFKVAPLAEQQQIAAKLDELLAQVDNLKARLDNTPKILKRFRQSVLAAAVSGKLTEDWRIQNKLLPLEIEQIVEALFNNGVTTGNFGKNTDRAPIIQDEEMNLVRMNSCNWPLVRIGAICECIVPNRDKPKMFSGGYHWLLTQHFEEQSIRIDYSKIEMGLSELEVSEYRAKVIAENSVVMTCVGRVGLSAVLSQKAVINQQLHAFIPNEYILPKFLAYIIRANIKYYEGKATSTTISYLNKTACNSLPIPLPAIEEQTEIVARVEQLFAYAEQIEQRVKDAQARVNHLTQAILAKAFSGELTADWRAQNPELISGDNSATALLARIKSERETVVKPKKTGKKAQA